MKGLHAVCLGCEVVKRDSYAGGSGTVFNLQVKGHGFNHTFRTNDRGEAESWPEEGAEIDALMELEPTKDANFRMGRVKFTRSPRGGQKPPAA